MPAAKPTEQKIARCLQGAEKAGKVVQRMEILSDGGIMLYFDKEAVTTSENEPPRFAGE